MTVKFNTKEMSARIRRAVARGIVAATEDVRGEALSLILDTPKTGRTYRRRGVEHVASAPGEAPASDTGRLANSIRTQYKKDGLVGVVVASTSYAARLEYGTVRMAARPYMRPALVNRRDAIEQTIADAIRAVL